MESGAPRRHVLFITGANPLRGGGGLETYVRAHALAADAAGLAAHIFCLARHSRVRTTAFGVIHEVRHAAAVCRFGPACSDGAS